MHLKVEKTNVVHLHSEVRSTFHFTFKTLSLNLALTLTLQILTLMSLTLTLTMTLTLILTLTRQMIIIAGGDPELCCRRHA